MPSPTVYGEQLPQSAEQELHDSPETQLPSPHTGPHEPQSPEQVEQLSLPLHCPSPQVGGVGTQTPFP